MSHSHDVMTSSVKMDFGTPPEFLDLVRRVSATGRIGLDPCTVESNPTGADHFYTPDSHRSHDADNKTSLGGFGFNWAYRLLGLCFVNPPFGSGLGPWTQKVAYEAFCLQETICLLPARTGSRWFENVAKADAICFYRGRLTFWSTHPVTGAYGPTVSRDEKASKANGRPAGLPRETQHPCDVWRVTPAAFDVVVPYWGERREAFLEVFEPRSTLTVRR